LVAVAKVLVLTRAIEGEAGCGAFAGKAEIDCAILVFWRAQGNGVLDVVLINPGHRRAGLNLQLRRLVLEELDRNRGSRLGTWAHTFTALGARCLSLGNVVTFIVRE
jgi:hypothetical protein